MNSKSFFNVRNAAILFALFISMYIVINFSPYGVSKLLEITNGHNIIDMEMDGYSRDEAYEMLEALGEEGREFNLKYIIPLDFPFPLSYGLFFFVTLTLLMKCISKESKRPWIIGIVGLLGMLFDWLENIMIYQLLINYPERLDNVAKLADVFTRLKSMFISISILLIVIGVIIVLVNKIIRKR